MGIKNGCLLILIFIVQTTFAQNSGNNSIKILSQKKGVSIRGLSVPDQSTIWASGSNGSIALSVNGGTDFEWIQVKGYERRDFRSIHAWNNKEAIIVAVAAPAVILKTKDAGVSWYKVYENADTLMFLDAIHFKDQKNGCIVGDPISQRIFLLNTNDKGEHWNQVENSYFKSTLNDGEAFFASSNSNLTYGRHQQFLVSGGMSSRLWINGEAIALPLVQGGKSTGANSIAISPNANNLIIVGGDFAKDKVAEKNIAGYNYSTKTKNWILNNKISNPHGYRSSVVFIDPLFLITCGTSGVDISKDKGENWELISTESFHVLQKQPNTKAAFLAGSGGRIGYIKWD